MNSGLGITNNDALDENIEGAQAGRSLVWILVRSAALWVIPALLITAAALIWFYRASTYRYFDAPLVDTITALVAHTETDILSGTVNVASEPTGDEYQRALSGRYWLVGTLNANGSITTIEGSPSLYGATISLNVKDVKTMQSSNGDIMRVTSFGPDNEPLRIIAQLLVFPDTENKPVIIVAAADRRPVSVQVRNFSVLAFGLMSLLVLGLVTAILTQVRLGLKPLFELSGRVADIREGRSKTVTGRYPKEIKPLADELNVLINHNREVVEYARTHVGNLAHALKTPLAVLVNEAEAKDKVAADIVGRQSEIMSKQVAHHLRRARAAVRGQSIGVQTPIGEVLTSLARTLEKIYRDKDLNIELDIGKGFVFHGEKRDLEEMAGNLMDNACKWTQANIKVTVRRAGNDGNKAKIIIDDDGPGLAENEYETVLKRGERLDESTPGSGFGLSIVNDLARAYKGNLRLAKSPLGGLRTILTIPLVKDSS